MNLMLTTAVHYPGDGDDKSVILFEVLFTQTRTQKNIPGISNILYKFFPKKSLDVAQPFNIKHNLREL